VIAPGVKPSFGKNPGLTAVCAVSDAGLYRDGKRCKDSPRDGLDRLGDPDEPEVAPQIRAPDGSMDEWSITR